MDEFELTELADIEVARHDAVKHPATGAPILVMKAVNAVGGIDEKPDIAGAHTVLAELAKLIQSEAAEMAVGADHEIWDIQTLCEAACLMRCFLEGEMCGDEDDGSMMKSADGLVFKAHRKFSSDERKKLAGENNALPDGSYPIPDEDALRRAAILARSGHGDVAAARKLIARRAKELGVKNPLDDNSAQKDAPEGVTPETSAPDTAETVDKSVDDKIAEAIAEVKKDAEKREEALKSQLDELRKTPIPGQIALTAPPSVRDVSARGELLKEVAYFERQAALTRNDREASAYYEGVLREKRNALEALS